MPKKKKKQKDVENMIHKEIKEADIGAISEEWLLIYGSNINIARMAPLLIDGLKPVSRRALFGMYMNPTHGMTLRKVARASADTIAYHPHGDTSVSEAIYGMGASWANNVMYVTPQGNFGNVRGDSPAHPRYTEVKLSKAAHWIFFADLKDSNVPMRPTYDGESLEPDYLPARIPTILCNPQFSGIGIGLASNIPSFNLTEVCKATIKLLKDPNAKIMLVPDSPTGCDVIDDGQFPLMNEIGDDVKLTLRATYEIDYTENIITITSLPLQVSVEQVIQSVVALRKAGKLEGLIDIHDASAEADVDLSFILKSDVNPDEFINQLIKKKSNLKKTYAVEIRAIQDLQTRVWGIKELLLEWIEYRRECVRAIYNKKLMDVLSDNHMNDVFLFVFNGENLSKTIKIARKSKNRAEMEQAFMKEYGITSLQAKTLSEMRTYQYNAESYEKYKEKKKEYKKKIQEYTEVLEKDDGVDAVILSQLEEAIKLFGTPRKSAIVKAGKMAVKIPNTNYLVGISKDGYIKKVDATTNTSIGQVGKISQVIVTLINNRDNLLIFDSSGRISRVAVSSLPEMNVEDTGVELARYFKLRGAPISIINEADVKDAVDDIILITENGSGKRTKLSEFAKIKDFKEAISLTEDDYLVSAIPAGDEEFIIYTNFGDGLRLKTSDIKRQSKTARGLNLITLRANEKVVGIDLLAKGCDKILYITSMGRMKLTEGKLLPLMNRRDEPLSLIGLENNEYLIGVGFVSMKDKCLVYRKKAEPVEVNMKDVPITTRVAKAEKIVKLPKSDVVTGFTIIRG